MKRRTHIHAALAALALALCATHAHAQDTVTGAFEGVVRDRVTSAGVRGASVEIVNEENGLVVPTKTDARGYFYFRAASTRATSSTRRAATPRLRSSPARSPSSRRARSRSTPRRSPS